MKNIAEKVNLILADWNPIGVPSNIAIDEYRGYIPLILKSITDRQKLMDALLNILVNNLGFEIELDNEELKKDLKIVVDKLISLNI